MTTRTTLRLGGLTAAIVLSLAIVSSASARPVGIYTPSKQATVSVKAAHLSGSWLQHRGGTSVNGAATGGISHTGAPSIPVTVVEQVDSSGFGWTDAAIGALFGVALAFMAVYVAMTVRGRRGRIALGA